MNILISGASGYIGSYFVNNFMRDGHDLGVIVREDNINRFEGCEIIASDISKKIDKKLSRKYELLIHLAAANDVISKNSDMALAYTTLGTKNILEFCKGNGIKRIIYFSTFQVYGKDSGILNEETDVELKNDYALTHFFAEKYVESFFRNYGIEYIILRPTNIFGGFLSKNINRWSLVPGCFCKEAFETQEIILRSSGRQMRDFISLGKVYEAVIHMIGNFDEVRNSIYNLCSGESTSILEIAYIVKECYTEIFSRECIIRVLSNHPENKTELVVSPEKLEKMGIDTRSRHLIKSEIRKTFDVLTA